MSNYWIKKENEDKKGRRRKLISDAAFMFAKRHCVDSVQEYNIEGLANYMDGMAKAIEKCSGPMSDEKFKEVVWGTMKRVEEKRWRKVKYE